MVSIGGVVKALGLTQFLHSADLAKFEFWSNITYLKPNVETRQAQQQLEKV